MINNVFKNKVVLVTGAGGSIGSELCTRLLQLGVHRLKCYDISEYSLYRLAQRTDDDPRIRYLLGDVRDRERLERAVASSDFVIHTAALKHVKYCEFNPDEAIKTNVVGTQNVVDACRKHGVSHCLLISTDKAVNPTSVMGTTKLLAEKIFINAPERNSKDSSNKTKFTVVRFGNVFGSAGSVVETFYKQISSGKKITLTNEDISRYFMSIKTACDLVLDCINLSKGERETPVFILKMKKLKIKDIAERMNTALQKTVKLQYEITGLNRGEKFDESLFTDFESQFMKEEGEYLVVTKHKQSADFSIEENFMSRKAVDVLINEWLDRNSEV